MAGTGLDPSAVEAALQYLEEKIGPLTPAQREDWSLVLPLLHSGELRPAIEKWVHRPVDPHAVLDYVITGRLPVTDHPPVLGPTGKPRLTPEIQEHIDRAREAINRVREAEDGS